MNLKLMNAFVTLIALAKLRLYVSLFEIFKGFWNITFACYSKFQFCINYITLAQVFPF